MTGASGQPPPFAQWLGRERFVAWADYYELLAISRGTADSQAITAVADRLISRVGACDPGEHGLAREKLLQQLQAAKECLTDPERRAAYDRRVLAAGDRGPEAARLASDEQKSHPAEIARPPVALATPPPVRPEAPKTSPSPQSWPRPMPSAARLQTISHAHALRRQRRLRRTRFWVFTLLGASTMATTVWLSYYVLRGHQSGERPRLQAAAESRTAGAEAAELDPQVRESDAHARAEVFEPADATADQRRSPSRFTRSMHLPPGNPRGPIDIATARPARTPEQPEMTWEQASALSRELQAAKEGLAHQDVETARRRLEAARQIAAGSPAAAVVSRWSVLTHYLAEFWSAVHQRLDSLHAGDEIVIEDKVLAFVERRDENTIILRSQGQNREVTLRPMSPKLAFALADDWLDETLASTPLVWGAFFAVDPLHTADDARREWRRAELRGEDVSELRKTLADDLAPEAFLAM